MSEFSAIPNVIFSKSDFHPILFGLEQLDVGLDNYTPYISCSHEDIAERQKVFREILAEPDILPLYERLYESLNEIIELQRKTLPNDDGETLVYSILEIRSFCEIIDFFKQKLSPYVETQKITSKCMTKLIMSCCAVYESEEYKSICAWMDRMNHQLNSIKSVTLGANLDAQLQIKEIGIVSFNPHPFVGGGIIKSLFQEITAPEEYKCMISLGIHETKSLFGKNAVSINHEMFTGMNSVYKSTLKRIRKELFEYFKKEISALCSVTADLKFIIDCGKYLRRITKKSGSLVFPTVSNQTHIQNLYLPKLLDKVDIANIVCNDVCMDANNRIYILTGPNSGGKSVYLNSVGISQILFQLGLPIPATKAEMKIFNSIAAIYVQDTKNSKDGRLAEEVIRLKKCITSIKDDTLMLLDETFSSTSAFDGVFLAESLIKYLHRSGIYLIYITHFHELAQKIPQLNEDGFAVKMLTAENNAGKRTYKIVPYSGSSSETSLAKDIVIENGLGFLFE